MQILGVVVTCLAVTLYAALQWWESRRAMLALVGAGAQPAAVEGLSSADGGDLDADGDAEAGAAAKQAPATAPAGAKQQL